MKKDASDAKTLVVNTDTKKKLSALKVHPRETYEQVIRRIVLGEDLIKERVKWRTNNPR